ncbi:putative adhesin [Dryocola sp. BD626]|uniref:putative adhesin n=1 Tax=Dryocola sp. BD626 TaxID=3133273 RepID=UPI003F508489
MKGTIRENFPGTHIKTTARVFPQLHNELPTDCLAWEVSRECLIFTAGKTKGQDLLIACDGGYLPMNKDFAIPGNTSFVVLGPHKAELMDPGLRNLLVDSFVPWAQINSRTRMSGALQKSVSGTKRPGHFRNYILSKYQFDSNEEYLETREFIELNYASTQQNNPAYTRRRIDVMSIRSSGGKLPATLKGILRTLREKGISYEKIILCFCRSTVGGVPQEFDPLSGITAM